MNHTKNYGLPQWELNDLIRMEDFNSAMGNIESGIDGAKAEAKADDAETRAIANSAKATANAAKTTADTAKSTADAARAAKPYVTGSYIGRAADQSIRCGFRPSFVIVAGVEQHADNETWMHTNYVAMSGGYVMSTLFTFTDTGFIVNSTYGRFPNMVSSGRTYDYIAFR